MRTAVLRKAGAALVAVFALLAVIDSSNAAVVILRDGFVLKGKLKREGETIIDRESGQPIPVAKGFWFIDDYARRIFFSSRYISPDERAVDERDVDVNPDLVVLTRPFVPMFQGKLESIGAIGEVSDFDNNWERTFKFTAIPSGVDAARQKMVLLTPNVARVDAAKYRWSAHFITRELGADTVRTLLYAHPDLREKEGRADPKKRTKIFSFLKQAGMYDAADQALTEWLRDAPGARAEIDKLRTSLQSLRVDQLLSELERGYQAGRHDWVRQKLENFPREGADEKQLTQLALLKRKYEAADESLKEARRFLKELPAKVSNAATRRTWETAAIAILGELSIDNAPRLEKFVQYALQAERDAKMGNKPSEGPEDLMARAVRNWLLASTAPAKPEEGLKLWQTRQFVLEYQRTANQGARQKMLASYEKEGALAFDELAQLISLLPPPEPEQKLDKSTLELETKEPVARRKGGMPYVLQLPPEYKHGRSYPVLFVLHHAGDKPANFLEKWSELAASHGYLLVAPDWADGGLRRAYTYTAEEHLAVTEVLRDLQRRFNVDTERVFMAGFGDGAVMAWDVGLSHPDLFAGVVTIGGAPRYFPQKCFSNGTHLPYYVVCGDLQAGDAPKNIRRQFENLFVRSAPAIWVEYKGRGFEWFDAEVANAIDWMSRKKRMQAFPETTEFQAMRPSDNRFYWLTVDGIENRHIQDARTFNHSAEPARVSAKIVDGKEIRVTANGFKSVTVWLGRGMIDFDKPISINVGVASRWKDRKVTPSLTTLLEDFYERGDRSRLFLVKIPLGI